MRLAEIISKLIDLLNEVDRRVYERAIMTVAKPDGFGILSDRLLPGISVGRVTQQQLAVAMTTIVEANASFVAQCQQELVLLIKAIETETETETEKDNE